MNIFKNNTNIFDGKGFASKKENELKIKVNTLTKKGIKPKLVSIKIGENRDSDIYLTLKKKVADRIGIKMEVVNFSRKDDLLLILYSIQKLNKDASVHGIMIQLPIPDNFTALQKDTLIDAIDSKKDVDGMTSKNLGRLYFNSDGLVCCTPKGIMKLVSSSFSPPRFRSA